MISWRQHTTSIPIPAVKYQPYILIDLSAGRCDILLLDFRNNFTLLWMYFSVYAMTKYGFIQFNAIITIYREYIYEFVARFQDDAEYQ